MSPTIWRSSMSNDTPSRARMPPNRTDTLCTPRIGIRLPLRISSIEGDDLHPVRAFARRILPERLERAGGPVDLVDRDRIRLLAAHHHVAALGIDAEPARLLLGRRAREIGQLAGGGVDAERPDRAAGALRGVQELAVRRDVQVRGPDVVRRVAR